MKEIKTQESVETRRSPYVVLEGSAYDGRRLFKIFSFVLAALAFAAVLSVAPAKHVQKKEALLESAAAPAVEEESMLDAAAIDTSLFYTGETPVNISIPALEEEAQETARTYGAKSVVTRESDDFSVYVSALSDADAHAKMEEIREEKAREERERQARIARQRAQQAAAQSGNWVRLNTSGVPMSEKSGYVELDENGVPLHYSYSITGNATAYYSGYITSTGTRPMQGTVAVNPRQIPYGTRMWITSADGRYVYGLAVAEDTGGFIHFRNGATVDLYMHSYDDCVTWGWRSVNIYILD